MRNLLLVAIVFMGLVCSSHGIKCYICADCEDNVGMELDCGMVNSKYCLKAVTSSGVVSRACQTDELSSYLKVGCSKSTSMTVCKCDTDLCNDATMSVATMLSVLVSLCLAILVY